MSEAVKTKALEYYPVLWLLGRLEALVEAGKLTRAELDAVVEPPEKGLGDIV